jgi:hypothetical protein
VSEEESEEDVVPSPRSPAASQRARTDSDAQPVDGYDDDDGGEDDVEENEASSSRQRAPPPLRLALASLSLGWLPGGAAGAAALRAHREAAATAHGLPHERIDDDADPTEEEEEAMGAAEAARFWAQLDGALEWR